MPGTLSPFYFGTNFKMHQTHAESRQFVLDLQGMIGTPPSSQLFLIPPFTSLPGLPAVAGQSGIWIGAQNMHYAASGAYTGEISPVMLQALGCDLVMLGHAERRHQFNETDELLNRKVLAAVAADLRVLLCIGETATEKTYGLGAEALARQLKIALYGLSSASLSKLMIAYEPVWAIGEGSTPATTDDIVTAFDCIRAVLARLFGDVSQQVPVLYGGSVNLSNCADYARLHTLDGLFVGRAVRQVEDFVAVFKKSLANRQPQ